MLYKYILNAVNAGFQALEPTVCALPLPEY